MGKGRIPKHLLYGELEKGTRKTGRPFLRFKDVCKRDMKSAVIDIERWEFMVKDHSTSRKRGNQACIEYMKHAKSGEEKYQKNHGHSGTTQYNFQM